MLGLAEAEARRAQEPDDVICALCGRQLGHALERHHVVPKSEGGTETVPLHPICHRTIHAFVTNRELATSCSTMDQLRERDDVRRYLRWIAASRLVSEHRRGDATRAESRSVADAFALAFLERALFQVRYNQGPHR